MSKLENLIQEFCSDGVEYKKLGEIASISRGGNFQKKDFCDNGVPCIHYGQIYTQYGLFANKTFNYISQEAAEKSKFASKNDIIMAVTSENVNDVCKCVAWLGDNRIAVSGHTAIIHHNQDAKYMIYFLSSNMFFMQKIKYAHGTKVIEVTPDKLNDIIVPLPPLCIQREIVRILDNFTEFTEGLTTELTARKQQYEYYNSKLLNFESHPYHTLEKMCDIVDYRGKTPKKVNEGIFLVTAKNIRFGYIDYEKSQEYIAVEDYENVMRRGKPQKGDVLITTEAPCGNVAQVDNENIGLAQRVIKYRPKNSSLNATFLKYILLGTEFQNKLLSAATGGTVKGIKGSKLHKLTIPVPPLEEQQRIVAILDRFDKLCNDINEGLPAEIKARQQQYEYYRDKLLTFKEKEGCEDE